MSHLLDCLRGCGPEFLYPNYFCSMRPHTHASIAQPLGFWFDNRPWLDSATWL